MASLPIKEMDTVSKMKNLFLSKGQIRDYLLFILSINTGINLKDLLGLRVKDVKNKQYLKLEQNKSIGGQKFKVLTILGISINLNKPKMRGV